MNFVNELTLEYKLKLIEEIEQRKIEQLSLEDAERMTQFLEAWKKS